jgi:hypothetical protein
MFEEIMKKNKELAAKVAAERLQKNKTTLGDYKITQKNKTQQSSQSSSNYETPKAPTVQTIQNPQVSYGKNNNQINNTSSAKTQSEPFSSYFGELSNVNLDKVVRVDFAQKKRI